MKVPKIKIRIGPGPFSAAPLFDLQSTQQIISAGLHSQLPAIDESKIILTQLSTKTEVLQHSTSISTAPDKLKTTRCSSPVQKIILIDDQQTTTPSAKTPPSREDVKKGAKKRKRSPKRAFSLLVETTMKESSIPAIGQDQSSSATDMSQIKDEGGRLCSEYSDQFFKLKCQILKRIREKGTRQNVRLLHRLEDVSELQLHHQRRKVSLF